MARQAQIEALDRYTQDHWSFRRVVGAFERAQATNDLCLPAGSAHSQDRKCLLSHPEYFAGQTVVREPDGVDSDLGQVGIASKIALPIPWTGVVLRPIEFEVRRRLLVEHVEPYGAPAQLHRNLAAQPGKPGPDEHMLVAPQLQRAATAILDLGQEGAQLGPLA